MNISKNDLIELRKHAREEIKKHVGNERLKLDKELLEQLIFDYHQHKDGTMHKTIAWCGDFLRKIDLSDVSFDYVDWDNSDRIRIGLDNTNAKIDFSKAYKRSLMLEIKNCSFENVDLSQNELDSALIDYCNFSSTGIRLKPNCKIFNSNLKDLDLSSKEHSLTLGRILDPKNNQRIISNNFQNTGIHIKLVKTAKDTYYRFFCLKPLGEKIKAGNFTGCYINGVKILSPEEAKEKREARYKEIEALKLETKRKVLQQIKDAISASQPTQKSKI